MMTLAILTVLVAAVVLFQLWESSKPSPRPIRIKVEDEQTRRQRRSDRY